MTYAFAVTWDYRCPFARNAHDHVVEGLRAGADWQVSFVPFSLDQVHVADGEADVWDDPAKAPALLAIQAAIVVRERFPDRFLDVHQAIFSARHDDGRDLREAPVIHDVLQAAGVDADAVFREIEAGWPLEAFRKEHEAIASDAEVWGVPTFIKDGRAVFVRLMNRADGDGGLATSTVERLLQLMVSWPELNEFKHTSIPR